MLSSKLQLLVIVVSAIGLTSAIFLISRTVLELKYAFIWLLLGVITLLLSLFPFTLNVISDLVGIQLPVNALFLFGFCFVFCILFSLTVIASRNAQRVKVLNQELAILKTI
jgi:hypothetical protein